MQMVTLVELFSKPENQPIINQIESIYTGELITKNDWPM